MTKQAESARRRYREKHGIPLDAPKYSTWGGHPTGTPQENEIRNRANNFIYGRLRRGIPLDAPFYPNKNPNVQAMKRLRKSGMVLKKIGHFFGVSKQRIHQLLK